eukprot:GHRR01036163.1.p1 GENE.GHRR01036163.1~~GHRR01036163.1.p1  ORF type:complete len:159 (-),score=37.03 GHRR01036163.1:36-512(-)
MACTKITGCPSRCQLIGSHGIPMPAVQDSDSPEWMRWYCGIAGLNYFQSVTPRFSAGGEFFWLGGQLRSGVGLAVRHTGDNHIATMQLATTGILSAQYAHKVTDKVTLATDLLWHWTSREATATMGYDVSLRQARLQGKIDSAGEHGGAVAESCRSIT